MNTLKKMSALLLTLMLTLSMCMVTVSAAETDDSSVGASSLSISSTSNYFPSANVTTSTDKTVCLEYVINSSMNLVNGEFTLTYDNTKLSVDTSRSSKFMPNVTNEVSNVMSDKGTIKANFSEVQNIADFSGGKVFARFYFNVIGSGSTTVNLDLTTLSVGYLDSNFTLSYAPVVRRGDVQTGVTSISGFENLTISADTKLTEEGAGNTKTIYFALPRTTSAKDAWSGVDFYYSSTTKITDATRLAMTKTSKVIPAVMNSSLTTLESGNLDVYSLTLSEDQVSAVDSAKAVGFVKADAIVRTGMSTTYSVLKATSDGTYSTTSKSIADFDGKTFVITSCYNTAYENTTYTGYWADNSGYTGYEISFAAPRGTTAQSTWTGAEVYYNSSSTSIKDAVRIPMNKTSLVIKAAPNTTNTTLRAGEWSVYSVKLTEDQMSAIDSSKLAGFVVKNGEVRTGARSGKTILNSTTTDGTFTTSKSSIKTFVGKTFIITDAYDAAYERSTYTGYWSTESGYTSTATATIYFAAPISNLATRDWTDVDFYYSVTSKITDATRVAMTKTDKVLKVDSSLSTLKSGEWPVYKVTLSANDINEIGSSLAIGFAKGGSTVRTGMRTAYSILKAGTDGTYENTGADITDFDGKMFVINGCYDSKYEVTTYTGYWATTDNTSARTESATIRFAAPSSWSGVNLYYNSSATITGAKTIAMTKTSKTKAVTVSGLKTLTSGNWTVYEVTLTGDQIAAIDKSTVVGFANSANSNNRTNAGKIAYSVMNATTSGTYDALSNSVIDYNGLTFVINGCYDSKYEAKTYIGSWAA